ncbi:50S ribosomal protein L25 [Chloroflexota bacterium]
MDGLTLQASKREILGKKTRFLRRQGLTPAHLFGHGVKSLALQCDTGALQKIITQAGTTRLISLGIEGEKQSKSVFIREVQREAHTGALTHVDLYQVRMKEKIKADIPIVLVGTAPAMKEKGRVLNHGVTHLSIECLPDKLPPQIEVDLSPLQDLDRAIHVRDIDLGSDITVFTDPEQMVVKVGEVYIERVEEAPAGAEAVEAKAEVEAATAGEPATEE